MPGCKALTDAEIQLTLNRLPNLRDRCFFIIALRTGFRVSELLSIRVCDILEYGNIRTHLTVTRRNMKGSKASRTVKLHNDAICAIRLLVDTQGLTLSDPLFKSRLGCSISRIQAYRILKRAFHAAQISGKTGTHSCRKTFATKVYDASGNDIRVTQHALGHRSLNSTASYLAVEQDDIDDIISQIS